MAKLGATTYAAVVWTAGDVLTEAKLDNMVANDQAYDSHAAQGLLLNNDKAYCGKNTGGTAKDLLYMSTGDQATIGEADVFLALPWQPCFAVTKNDAQVMTKAAFTKVQYDDEEFDQDSNYDAVTNYRFIVPTNGDGVYFFYAASSLVAMENGKMGLITIYKNGSEERRGVQQYAGAAGTEIFTVGALLDLVATDYIEVFMYHTNVANKSLDAAATSNHFQGWKVA